MPACARSLPATASHAGLSGWEIGDGGGAASGTKASFTLYK
jgi:hypothetical protein